MFMRLTGRSNVGLQDNRQRMARRREVWIERNRTFQNTTVINSVSQKIWSQRHIQTKVITYYDVLISN